MSKLCSFAFALVVSLAACVDEEIEPLPPSDDDEQVDDGRTPIDPTSGLPDPGTQCAGFDSKGDAPCTPP